MEEIGKKSDYIDAKVVEVVAHTEVLEMLLPLELKWKEEENLKNR